MRARAGRPNRRFQDTGMSAAMAVLKQMATIMRTEELVNGGAALLYLAPYWQINTGFTGGYQRITTWNDAFRSGATYGWSTHTAHNATQSEPSYAGNLATLTGGGSSVLTFDNSTCRYTVGGTFSAKTAHSVFVIEDVQSLPSHVQYFTAQAGTAFGSTATHYLQWTGPGTTCTSLQLATGQHAYGVCVSSGEANVIFYRDGASETVAKGVGSVAALSAPVLFSYLSSAFGASSKRAFFLYCSGNHPELAPLVNALQADINDLTVSAAVTILNQIKAICQAEEAAGGSCFMLLPGDWTVQQPILTLVDVLTNGVLPGVSYAGHTAHDASQALEPSQPWTDSVGSVLAPSFSTLPRRMGLSMTVTSPLTVAHVYRRLGVTTHNAVLFGANDLWCSADSATHKLTTISAASATNAPATGVHTVGWLLTDAAWTVSLDGGAPAACGSGAISTTLNCLGGYYVDNYYCNAVIGLHLACTGNHPELIPLARQWGQFVAEAP